MSGVTVVIPNWNRRDLVEQLLERLRRQTCTIQEIIVVDNGSTDGSADSARAKGATVIALGRNFGFSHAVNCGVEKVTTPWVAIVNNDVEPAPDWLEKLLKAADHPRVWFATGKIYNQARRDLIDGTYDVLCRGACAWRAGHGRRDGPVWSEPKRIRLAPFTAALFRTELFRSVGGLDERFESYLEDVDFCLRCAMRGFYGVYVPEAAAYHAGSATLGVWNKDTVRRISRNQVLLMAKHYPDRYLLRYAWPIFVAQMLWGFLAVRHGRGFAFATGKLEGVLRWNRIRRIVKRSGGFPRGLSRILEHGESEIYHLQGQTGFDAYWRVYFALTS